MAVIQKERASDASFDVTMDGLSATPGDGALVREFADAGVTWWLELLFGLRRSRPARRASACRK